ncbi:N-6 DNA methylase [Micromonospora sp. STR1_7]|uniref:N-6 DNA methylase n=1 Tax=Micromonospora parastrephiae TaxID=2806101 RepID=A0ABS1XQP8_9ACTN|nr:N-6 DNA methylase [Micromonospora parastrephiae]MBM0231587.1 N-6 DNA methylase [Micromonospora parastrephiae]
MTEQAHPSNMQVAEGHTATVIHPGSIQDRPTIELRVGPQGSNEAFLVPSGGEPIATGVSLEEQNGQFYIRCRIRKKRYRFTPEEVVRQYILNTLIQRHGYPESQVAVEVPIQMGSAVHAKPADIVVFADDKRDRHWITVEVKKPNRKDGIEQLKSYMNASGSIFGYWTNGADEKFLLRSDPNDFSKPVWRLPRHGETLQDVDEPLTRTKLTPVKDLYGVFKDIEQEILAHQTVDTFNEIFKLVFAKLYDERVNLYNDSAVAQFKLGLSENRPAAVKRVKDLFESAKQKWRDVYSAGDVIELNDTNVEYCIKALQQYHLIRSGDVLGVAFELLVNQEMKGEMGQYFTPRQVVGMITEALQPKISERVCDPACGSGGFLIFAMRSVFDFIADRWDDADDRAEQRKDYAQENLIGLDNDPRLIRVAKAYMIMENDGRAGIRSVDALDYGAWDRSLRERLLGRSIDGPIPASSLANDRTPSDGVDVILTNPPFAGAIKAVSTLRQYDLARPSKGKPKAALVRAVLFLERCLDLLKPGGRMGIVLPQGLFNNFNDQEIRDFVDKRARVLGVVGLHPYTFKPFTLAKTSVLFLQKWKVGEEPLEDYRIFTAVSTRPGKTKLGRPQYLDDGITLDCDMAEIAATFRQFAKEEGLEFA